MKAVLNTLTDFEVSGLHANFCLADGHAYQDLHPAFNAIIESLPQIWQHASEQSIPEAEQLFSQTFANFINCSTLKQYPYFRICPTASNSIDLIGAVLNQLQVKALLIEPAFDNLALLVRRRGVTLDSIDDKKLYDAAETNTLDESFPFLKNYGALFIVHPNNPTGLILSEQAFLNILNFCKMHDIILVIDNCFRIYRRNNFDDYKLLIDSSVRFLAFEDTGKVWPTQDLKASLVYCSEDLSTLFNEIYNEVYLCVSNFTLRIIASFYDQTALTGVQNTIWNVVDKRREVLRNVLKDSNFFIPNIAQHSSLPVEWISFLSPDKNDLKICNELKQFKLAVLPGRYFYWNSAGKAEHQKFIRISLMKRELIFSTGMNILSQFLKQLNAQPLNDLSMAI